MAVKHLPTRGYGSFGTVNLVITRGYIPSVAPDPFLFGFTSTVALPDFTTTIRLPDYTSTVALEPFNDPIRLG